MLVRYSTPGRDRLSLISNIENKVTSRQERSIFKWRAHRHGCLDECECKVCVRPNWGGSEDRLGQYSGRLPQGNKPTPAVRQDCRSVFSFHPLGQASPTAPPPLATQCDFHLFFTARPLPPSMNSRSMCWSCPLASLGHETFLPGMASQVTNRSADFTLLTFKT